MNRGVASRCGASDRRQNAFVPPKEGEKIPVMMGNKRLS